MLKRHNILPTKTSFFISSEEKIESVQEFKIALILLFTQIKPVYKFPNFQLP